MDRPPATDLAHRPFGALSLYESETVQIGVVRCDPDHADFRDPGPVSASSVLFSGSAIRVERPGHGELISGAGRVTFYNRGELARRFDIGCGGDDHTWLAVRPDVAADTLADLRPRIRDHPDAPFTVPQGPADPVAFLAQGLVVAGLSQGLPPDELQVEEVALFLLRHAVRVAEGIEAQPDEGLSPRARDLGEHAKAVLARRFAEPRSLADVASEIGCTHFHLARTFRAHTGQTLHQYRTRLRLARALAEVLDGERDLADLALRLGYSSHSHMTHVFRSAFAATPSAVRAACERPDVLRALLRSSVEHLGSRT